MQVGCHVSASGSIDKSVDNAVERIVQHFRYLQEVQDHGMQKILQKK